jgi:hypothetical protein
MSGGYFNYQQSYFGYIADQLEQDINYNNISYDEAVDKEYVGQAFSLPRKKLKVFRLEAVRAGFRKAWQERDYAVIVTVADKIPNNVLEENPKLLMWHDQAVIRMGGE